MIVGVVSGKGGTGKTTVAVNLAAVAEDPVMLLDCDVEEPNCHLFFDSSMEQLESVSIGVPRLEADRCIGCGDCAELCEFQVLAFLAGKPLVFPELCHGCGGCFLACPTGALIETRSRIGVVERSRTNSCTLIHGRLNVGKALSPPLIKAVRRYEAGSGMTIVDGPPGTTCSLAAALVGCDLALLVAEPTPFGVHDLELLIDGARKLGMPMAAVINRATRGSAISRDLCAKEGIPVLAEVPESEEIARVQARGKIASHMLPEIRTIFERLWPALSSACHR